MLPQPTNGEGGAHTRGLILLPFCELLCCTHSTFVICSSGSQVLLSPSQGSTLYSRFKFKLSISVYTCLFLYSP